MVTDPEPANDDHEPTHIVTAKNPQHLWVTYGGRRRCDVCDARQTRRSGAWQPRISPTCPGDNGTGRRLRANTAIQGGGPFPKSRHDRHSIGE
jgi:hypothetical protein